MYINLKKKKNLNMRIKLSIGVWITLLTLFAALTNVSKQQNEKKCFKKQFETCLFMFYVLTLNLLLSNFLEIFKSCTNCLHKTIFIFAGVVLPPFYVLLSCLLMMTEQNICGDFQLEKKSLTSVLRILQVLFLFLITIIPLTFDIIFVALAHDRNEINFNNNNNSDLIEGYNQPLLNATNNNNV